MHPHHFLWEYRTPFVDRRDLTVNDHGEAVPFDESRRILPVVCQERMLGRFAQERICREPFAGRTVQ